MTIEELKQKEYESFVQDFKKLIDAHRETLLTLKMGIVIDYHISCVHYKGNSYSISSSGEMGIESLTEWHD